jgi:hypothetical protein
MDNGFGGKEYEIKKNQSPEAPVQYVAPKCANINLLRATAQSAILYCAESRLKS